MPTPHCPICHSIYDPTEVFISTPCGHVFHNECISEWFQTSETCPQCRKRCQSTQLKRIYIDFACDDDLACAQARNIKRLLDTSSSAEETIKILLEHIESPRRACECCEELQESLEKVGNENAVIISSLDTEKLENDKLRTEIVDARKRNVELQSKVSQHESKSNANTLRLLQMMSSEQALKNSIKEATIKYNNIERERNRTAQLLNDKNRENENILVENERALERSSKFIEELQDAISKVDETREFLQNSLKEATNKCNNIERERQQFERLLDDRNRELLNSSLDKRDLSTRIEELQDIISYNNKQIQDFEEMRDACDGHLEQLEEVTIKHLGVVIDRSKIEHTLEETQRENSNLSVENEELLKRVEELQNTKSNNESELKAMRERNQDFEEIRAKCDEHHEKLQAMTIKHSSVVVERSEIVHTLEGTKRENSSLLAENQELLNRVEELQNQICAKETELVTMHEQVMGLQDIRANCSHYFNRLEEMTNKCDDVEIELAQMAQTLAYKNRENARISADNKKLIWRNENLRNNSCANGAESEDLRGKFREFGGKSAIDIKESHEHCDKLNKITIKNVDEKTEQNDASQNVNLKDYKRKSLNRIKELQKSLSNLKIRKSAHLIGAPPQYAPIPI